MFPSQPFDIRAYEKRSKEDSCNKEIDTYTGILLLCPLAFPMNDSKPQLLTSLEECSPFPKKKWRRLPAPFARN